MPNRQTLAQRNTARRGARRIALGYPADDAEYAAVREAERDVRDAASVEPRRAARHAEYVAKRDARAATGAAARAATPKPPIVVPHVHRWAIESPAGPTSNGTCVDCLETRRFVNSYDASEWTPRAWNKQR